MQVVILAAGLGTRLGQPFPKTLTPLDDGKTILAQQIDNVRSAFGAETEIMIVVGFKCEQIMEAAPDVTFAYNELFDQTNTSKSLLRALKLTADRGTLWMNGDVVFDPRLLGQLQPLIDQGTSFVCVNTAQVGDEEVKYRTGPDGAITTISKQVIDAEGEAVGINFVSPADKQALIECLDAVPADEYFEGGIELAIAQDRARFMPFDITTLYAVEVDFADDLARANSARSR